MPQLRDIPRIYTGIAEIMSCFVLCLPVLRGKKDWRLPLKLAVGLFAQCVFLKLTQNVPLFLWLVCMCLAFGMMLLFVRSISTLERSGILYTSIRAFILAEFAASFEWQLYSIAAEMAGESMILSNIMMVLVYAALFFLAWRLEKRLTHSSRDRVYTGGEVLGAGLIGIAIFAFSNMGFLAYMLKLGLTPLDIFNTRTLVDLGGVAILYAYQFRIEELKAEKELAALQIGLQTQYEHYRDYQETIELINIKYHDLKHQAALLRAEPDPEKKEEYLRELERELADFRPDKQTGSRVLDIILAGKSVKMKNSQIQFTCVADGSLLDTMHVTDICAIFGNALDNAIEHVAQISDPGKRIISLTLSRKKEFIYIEISNYCDIEVTFEEGMPVTTKQDRRMHGYGVRSMVATARKYGGNVTFEEKDHFFFVRILIPMSA